MEKLFTVIIVFTIILTGRAQTLNPQVNSSIVSPPDSKIILSIAIDKNTKWTNFQNSVSNQPLTNYVFLEGTKTIDLNLFIPKDSVNYYRYNVIENDSKWLVSNALPKGPMKTPDVAQWPSMVHTLLNRVQIDLGKFDIQLKKLTVEYYKITDASHVSKTVIVDKVIKPAQVLLIAISATANSGEPIIKNLNPKDKFTFKVHDSIQINNIILFLKPTDFTFIYQVYLTNILSGKSSRVSNDWIYSRNGFPYLLIDAGHFVEPGDYEISITAESTTGRMSFPINATKIYFTVQKSSHIYSQKELILLVSVIVIFFGMVTGLSIVFLKKKNRRKIEAEQIQKKYVQMQLNAIRLHLNPHFVFNALTGIQNLMNKNDIDEANRYLTKFARLTRNILSNNELVTIADETTLLDDYLQMEQLRFGFKYSIEVDPQINLSIIEVPSMLLQPIVENAVKHGVADLGGGGIVKINLVQHNKNLVIFISDNGKGFDIEHKSDGLGLKLTKNRLELLNSSYLYSRIFIETKFEDSISTVIITFSEWL